MAGATRTLNPRRCRTIPLVTVWAFVDVATSAPQDDTFSLLRKYDGVRYQPQDPELGNFARENLDREDDVGLGWTTSRECGIYNILRDMF